MSLSRERREAIARVLVLAGMACVSMTMLWFLRSLLVGVGVGVGEGID